MNLEEPETRQEKCLDCCFSIFCKKYSLSFYNKKVLQNWNLKKQQDLEHVERKRNRKRIFH